MKGQVSASHPCTIWLTSAARWRLLPNWCAVAISFASTEAASMARPRLWLSSRKKLEGEGYAVFSLSFEGLGNSAFKSDETLMFASLLLMNDSVEWDEVQNLSDSCFFLY